MEGWKGAVYSGATKIGELNHWRANLTGNPTTKSTFGTGAVKRGYTLKDVDGDFSGNFDETDATQLAIIGMFVNGGTMADLFLYLYTSGVYGIYGNAVVTPSIGVDVEGTEDFNCGFAADGEWYENLTDI